MRRGRAVPGVTRRGRLLRYEVAHPEWDVYPVRSFAADVDWAALYGPEWAVMQGREPASVGVHHSEGTRAVALLAERNVAVPRGWRTRQDHPKRGLVLAVPAPAAGGVPSADELDAVLDWLLRATGALCRVRRTGEWRAYVHRR